MIGRRRPLLRAAMFSGVGYATYRAGGRGAGQAPHQAEQAASGSDRLATLAGFKELLDSGVLTPQEFDAEKRRILRG